MTARAVRQLVFVRLCAFIGMESLHINYSARVLLNQILKESISPFFSPAGITGVAVMGRTMVLSRSISMLLLWWSGGILNVPQWLPMEDKRPCDAAHAGFKG